MAVVIPFKGILYNHDKVNGSDVVAPPYDIITPELRDTLYKRSPYNIVRIDAGKEKPSDSELENKYTRSARYLTEWLNNGILIRSDKPCFYAYEIQYQLCGETKRLRGFFGLVRLEELGRGVYPHECTHSKPKEDRLKLMMTCLANTSPIFSLYRSDKRIASSVINKVCSQPAYMEAIDINVTHKLWIINEPDYIDAIRSDLSDKPILIADGHHRYETALEFQRIMKEKYPQATEDEAFNFVLMFLANIAEEDVTILPAHRLIQYKNKDLLTRLRDFFDLYKLHPEDDIIKSIRGKEQTFGLIMKEEYTPYLLKFKGSDMEDVHPVLRSLDVVILHDLIFKKLLGITEVHYEMNYDVAMSLVTKGDHDAAFFLNPTKVSDVERVALSSMRMPPKSTYFYPKVMTGFVINSLKNR